MYNVYLQGGLSRNDIKKSGNYVVVMAMCDPESFPVVVEGAIESVDPCEFIPTIPTFPYARVY